MPNLHATTLTVINAPDLVVLLWWLVSFASHRVCGMSRQRHALGRKPDLPAARVEVETLYRLSIVHKVVELVLQRARLLVVELYSS